jgi:hypothetical protein
MTGLQRQELRERLFASDDHDDDDELTEEHLRASVNLTAEQRVQIERVFESRKEVCGNREALETEQEDGRYSVVADTISFHDEDGDDDRDWDLGRELDLDDLASATRTPDAD